MAMLAALLLFASRDAHAYGWMIRHEYSACVDCHADPSGGGLLTSYGRAQSEALLRTHYGDPNEGRANLGAFAFGLFTPNDKETLLLGADARELFYSVSPKGAPTTSQWIWMQADVEAQLHVDRFRANASLGYAEQGALAASLTRGTDKNLVSRVHWLGVELDDDKKMLVRAGRMNLPFGLRSIEHTLWTRVYTRTDTNAAQQDGIAFSYNGHGVRTEVMGILGNFQLRPWSYHEYGYAGYGEYTPIPKLAVGLSSLVTHAELDVQLETPLWRHAHGAFARYSPARFVVLSLEQDLVGSSQPGSAEVPHNNVWGSVGYLTADFEPVQGVHLMTTIEDQANDFSRGGFSGGWWGGATWFFLPHADVRADVVYQSISAASGSRSYATTFLMQAHVFL